MKYIVFVVVVFCLGLLLFVGRGADQSSSSWAIDLLRQKRIPYLNGSFSCDGQHSVPVRYRIFKPVIDISKISQADVSPEWRKDPLDSFVRRWYVGQLDPNPSFAKLAESFVEGMKPINQTLEKLPQFRNDPIGYFNKFRGNYSQRKLLGEIVFDNFHIFVFVSIDNYGPEKHAAPFVKTDDGSYYATSDLWTNSKLLDDLAKDQYSIIFDHFPEYATKKE